MAPLNNEVSSLKKEKQALINTNQSLQFQLDNLTNEFNEYKESHQGSALGRFFRKLFHRS